MGRLKSYLKKKPTVREWVLFSCVLLVGFIVLSRSYIFSEMSTQKLLVNELEMLNRQKEAVALIVKSQVKRERRVDMQLQKMRIQESEMPEFVSMLSSPLVLQRLNLVSIQLKEKKEEGKLPYKRVVMKVTGSYKSLSDYLKRLRKLPVSFLVDKLDITPVKKSSLKVLMAIHGRVYEYKNKT